jgi:hypothetical protein
MKKVNVNMIDETEDETEVETEVILPMVVIWIM